MEHAPPRLGIVTGLAAEARSWAALADTRTFTLRTGLGRDAATQAALQCVAEGATALLSFGIAGGLDPHHTTGTVIVASKVVRERGPDIACDATWTAHLLQHIKRFPVIAAALADAPVILATPAEKQRLYALTGAVATDMESYGIGEVAAAHSLPFAAIRVIADCARDRIPVAALQAMSPNGSLRLAATILNILRSPADIPALTALGLRTRTALGRLHSIAKTGGPKLMPGN